MAVQAVYALMSRKKKEGRKINNMGEIRGRGVREETIVCSAERLRINKLFLNKYIYLPASVVVRQDRDTENN